MRVLVCLLRIRMDEDHRRGVVGLTSEDKLHDRPMALIVGRSVDRNRSSCMSIPENFIGI